MRAKGLYVEGTGSILNGSNSTIATSGTTNPSTGNHSQGLYNGNGTSYANGGSVTLTNSTISTTGVDAVGSDTESGGSTTLTGGSIKTTGSQSDAVLGLTASTTTLSGVQIATSGNGAKGLNIEGAGTILNGSNLDDFDLGHDKPVNRQPFTGPVQRRLLDWRRRDSHADRHEGVHFRRRRSRPRHRERWDDEVHGRFDRNVGRRLGGRVQYHGRLNHSRPGRARRRDDDLHLWPLGGGGRLERRRLDDTHGRRTCPRTDRTAPQAWSSTTPGSPLTATNVTVSTTGGIDPSTTYHANAIYNGPGSTGTSGGTLTLNNVTATAAGFQSSGVVTETGGTTTITGGSFTVTGRISAAALVDSSGNSTITGSALTATADGSSGLVMHGGGGSINASNLTIKVSGGVYSGNGDHAVGVVNGNSAASAAVGRCRWPISAS